MALYEGFRLDSGVQTEGRPRRALVRGATMTMAVTAALALCAAAAHADSRENGGFEGFALGDPLGQHGWTALDVPVYNASNFDIEIVDPSAAWGSELGARALRVSNAVTSSGYGNQLQSASLADEAGESTATASANAGGSRQTRLSGTFSFASATRAYQPGLAFSFAPDSGDGTRMANFRITDEAGGFKVEVVTLDESTPAFVSTTIASGLSHTQVHTLQFSLDFVEGVNNDILWVKVDESGCSTFTASGSWEQYHRFWAGNATPMTFTADSILFRVSGTAQPSLSGGGVLFDTFDLSSSTVPAMPGPGVPQVVAAPTATATGQHVDVADVAATSNACDPVTEFAATLTPSGGGSPITLTSATPDFDFDDVPAGSYNVTYTATNGAGTSSPSPAATVTVSVAEAEPEPSITPSPEPSIVVSPPAESEGDPESGEELAATGSFSAPLAVAAAALVGVGLAVRGRGTP